MDGGRQIEMHADDSQQEADYDHESDSEEEMDELDSSSSDLDSSLVDELCSRDGSTRASSPSVELIGKEKSSLVGVSQALDADETMDGDQMVGYLHSQNIRGRLISTTDFQRVCLRLTL